ncbi:MAG: hypothetical protein K2R98_13730 [Gemmataceae bacterium]|nr:hypothetical protein [Gemmataceae bacterium]
MANWGNFISEIPIINKRSEGIFVKVDHVIDLWDERNKLKAELEALRSGTGSSETAGSAPPAAEDSSHDAAMREREQCAREVEEFAQTCGVAPEYADFVTQLLAAAAVQLREKYGATNVDFLNSVVIPPSPSEVPTAEAFDNSVPMAEPIAEAEPTTAPLYSADVVPVAQPVGEGGRPFQS